MNAILIAIHEIKRGFRDRRTFLFMLAFPLVLMLILGTALSNAFNGGVTLEHLNLVYSSQATDSQLKHDWERFAGQLGSQGATATALPEGENGRDLVEQDEYTGYAEIDDGGIHYYGSEKHTIDSDVLQGMLSAFADKYRLAWAAGSIDPDKGAAIIGQASSSQAFIHETSLDPERQPGSIDYYAMAMSTMIAFWSFVSAGALISSEVKRRTAIRLVAAPVSRGAIFAGKVIGNTVVNFLCVVVVVLFSKYAFGANWGDHLGVVLLVLLTLVILAGSLGLAFSFLLGDSGRSVGMILAQFFSFLGGAYFPIGEIKGAVRALVNLSPLRWANEALTNIIYADNPNAALPAIGLNIAFAAALLLASALILRRREAL